ncbi:MAG TPA: hypothetical protein DHV28_01170 [Ignavibacteriales bacterium]|nr:hypothetical protein [Ignavibacteriales bacterium]
MPFANCQTDFFSKKNKKIFEYHLSTLLTVDNCDTKQSDLYLRFSAIKMHASYPIFCRPILKTKKKIFAGDLEL